jgi:hypothetical protein
MPTPADNVAVEWEEYPRIPAGDYQAYCSWAGKYYDKAFRRWTCILRFYVLGEDLSSVVACVPMWLSLGSKDVPRARRRGKYWTEWVRANGGPPVRGDRLSPKVFVHRWVQVGVADTKGNAPYSVVRRIIEWKTGTKAGSLSQQVTQSRTAGTKNTG